MTDSGVRMSALATTAAAYQLINIILIYRMIENSTLTQMEKQIVHFGVGVISITILYSGIAYVFYRYAARKFIGTWPYISEGGNCAIAKIFASSQGVNYKVDLYHTEEEVYDAILKVSIGTSFAQAYSIMSRIDKDKLVFTYSIDDKDKDYPPRQGILKIVLENVNDGRMVGHWESTVDDTTAMRKGKITLFSKEKFMQYFNAKLRKV